MAVKIMHARPLRKPEEQDDGAGRPTKAAHRSAQAEMPDFHQQFQLLCL
ncbi:hypothetical protein [Brevundimonas sp. TWP2-3-4b1]